MSKTSKRQDAAEEAARAHTDLNVFPAVIALMEHSLLSPACQQREFQIIRICKSEQARCLQRYDAALTKLNRM